MRKLTLISVLIGCLTIHLNAQSIKPNPIISKGMPVYTSSGEAKFLVDNKFKSEAWQVKDSSWMAILLENGPDKVFVNWNNPDYPWSNELSPAKCPNNSSFPVDYDILVSPNSSNGKDGDWLMATTIRGNIVTARGHLINFKGSKWVKIAFIKGGGTIDELQVFDASAGANDSWFFAGTSISAHTFKSMPPVENFADLIFRLNPRYNPIMIRGGIGCITSTDFVNNLPKYLQNASNVKYWAIEMGTNDAWGGNTENLDQFKKNLQIVIDSCKARGINPIIARVLATNPEIAKWQVNPEFLKAIDELTIKNKLIEGPDLYNWFLANPEELIGENDGVHPNKLGTASIQRLWAEKMEYIYNGCKKIEIVPYIKINDGEPKFIASAKVKKNDNLSLGPQIISSGTWSGIWSWIGPDGFKSKMQKIEIAKIKEKQEGNYVVTFSGSNGCFNSYIFKIEVE
jgi:lysophospholipase L1-like esterase